MDLAGKAGIRYVSGVELNVTFSHPKYREGKSVSLDFLGYQFDAKNTALKEQTSADGGITERKEPRRFWLILMRNLKRKALAG